MREPMDWARDLAATTADRVRRARPEIYETISDVLSEVDDLERLAGELSGRAQLDVEETARQVRRCLEGVDDLLGRAADHLDALARGRG
ncbi:MAG: hypothetical protein K6U87_15415 [Firmicutes bacterium]|nr:hypothetical protein [Bacillota bacterium]